jgi:hypothetical protein
VTGSLYNLFLAPGFFEVCIAVALAQHNLAQLHINPKLHHTLVTINGRNSHFSLLSQAINGGTSEVPS